MFRCHGVCLCTVLQCRVLRVLLIQLAPSPQLPMQFFLQYSQRGQNFHPLIPLLLLPLFVIMALLLGDATKQWRHHNQRSQRVRSKQRKSAMKGHRESGNCYLNLTARAAVQSTAPGTVYKSMLFICVLAVAVGILLPALLAQAGQGKAPEVKQMHGKQRGRKRRGCSSSLGAA